MWSVQSDKIMKQNKKKERVNFLISKDYRNRFKELCNKNGLIISSFNVIYQKTMGGGHM